jgi:hypothetical protein
MLLTYSLMPRIVWRLYDNVIRNVNDEYGGLGSQRSMSGGLTKAADEIGFGLMPARVAERLRDQSMQRTQCVERAVAFVREISRRSAQSAGS